MVSKTNGAKGFLSVCARVVLFRILPLLRKLYHRIPKTDTGHFCYVCFRQSCPLIIGTLSKDNADGDGNAIRSGKSQKVHCA